MNKFEIVSICAHCGKLIHLQNDIFSSNIFNWKNSSLPPIIPNFNKKRKIIFCCYNSLSIRFTKRLVCVQKLLTYNGTSLFPLCQDCTAIYSQQISMMIDFLKLASDDLHTINITIPIDKLQTRIDHLTTYISLKKKKPYRKRKSAPTLTNETEKVITIFDDEKKDNEKPAKTHNLNNSDLTPIGKRKTAVCPLLSFYTFYISSDHHYGTINKNRIGFFKYNQNTLTENNTALYFICHLIYQFKCAFKIQQICVSFNPVSVVVIQNRDEKNVNYASYILEFPTRRTRVNDFNESINHLFHAYSLICQASSKTKMIGEPPFQINFTEKKIERFSYFLNWKNVEEWSTAMKLFLINLKMIQYRTLRGCLDRF